MKQSLRFSPPLKQVRLAMPQMQVKQAANFFTPQSVSKLLAKIVMLAKDEHNKISEMKVA
jgi:hypothetical protein